MKSGNRFLRSQLQYNPKIFTIQGKVKGNTSTNIHSRTRSYNPSYGTEVIATAANKR